MYRVRIIDINNSFIDINNSFIDINNSFIDINKHGVGIHFYIDISIKELML